MIVVHGICTSHTFREGDKLVEATGELRHWRMDFFNIFDGLTVLECQLADDYGERPKVGDVVTAALAVSVFNSRVQYRLVKPVDGPKVTNAFTPELAAMLISTGLADALSAGDKEPVEAGNGRRAAE